MARGQDEPVQAGQGIMVGEVTEQSAVIQVRLTRSVTLTDGDLEGVEGQVEFILRKQGETLAEAEAKRSVTQTATASQDCIAKVHFQYLEPSTEYECVTRLGVRDEPMVDGPTATFRTLAGEEISEPVQFVVVTGMNFAKFHGDDRINRKQHVEQNNTELPEPYQGDDKSLGYPALRTILELRPRFFVGTGDNVYYDTPTKGRAETLTEMRQKWHEQFAQPRYRDLFSAVPTYWEIDDHDYRIDDCDNSGDYAPSPELAQRLMYEQLPYGGAGERPLTYRTRRVSRELQIWLLEGRQYRSDNSAEDGPDKSIWGKEQREWLQRTLLESDAKFKVLISPTPMVGPDDLRKSDNHTNLNGFRHEREAFLKWRAESGLDQQHFYVVCGDRHWQYHATDPSGLQEFSCGALVDANSRLGRKPGDPKSTDPDGEILQHYTQAEPSGGFLLVRSEPATPRRPAQLIFSFRDEHGTVLYEHVKQ